MPEKISITKESGETINSNIVSVFMVPDTNKKYIITTENAVDPHGLTVLHVSEIVDGTLQKIATDDEWSTIKTIMRAIISGNVVSYKYIPPIDKVNAVSQYSRDISVSASASKQMVDNYNAADKSDTSTEAAEQPEATGGQANTPDSSVNGANPELQPIDNATATPPLNSIFPTAGQTQSDNELIPGISEVSAEPQISPVQMPSNPIQQIPNITTQEFSIDPVTGMPMNGANVNVTPIIGDNSGAIGQVPIQPIQEQGIMNMGAMNSGEVQVADPSQIVPTGQIVQDAMTPGFSQNIPVNAIPSFNPNATLDEVVLASQEMFMEGVRNLVQTIQEKVYRDLYAKEANLKAREEALMQREQMLMNAQPMMNYNLGMQNQMMQNPNSVMPNNMPVQQGMGMMAQMPNGFNQQQPILQQNMGLMPPIVPNGPVAQMQQPLPQNMDNIPKA